MNDKNVFSFFNGLNPQTDILSLIKKRMKEKYLYAKSRPTQEEFKRELATGFLEIYKALELDK